MWKTLKAVLLVAGATAVLVAPTLAVEEAENQEVKLWHDTGWTHTAVVEARTDGAVAPENYSVVDEATIEQLERLRMRALERSDHPPGPDLKWVEPGSAPFPTTQPSQLQSSRADGDFIFTTNTQPSSVAPPGYSSTTNEPTTVSAGNIVLYTGNWYAALSTNGGSSFTYVNPFTSPFAPVGGGFCCDQTTVYDPVTNSIFWLQQYIEDGTTGVQRINVDRGADGVFDCHYDITPQLLGFPNQNWLDYPDLALSDTHLFQASNVFSTPSDTFTGAVVARYALAEMSNCLNAGIFYYSDLSFGSFRLSRGATNTMYFASHISNSSLRIWSWPNVSTAPASVDRTITTWANDTRACPGPDGNDACGFIDARLEGAWDADGVVGFMWVPSQDGSFPYPYTRIARFNRLDLSLIDEPTIWAADLAWIYPSVDVNNNGNIGGSIMAGGGIMEPACVMWLSDDFNGDSFAPLENKVAAFGSAGPSSDRSGDYNVSRVHRPNGLVYSGACFSYPNPGESEARYVRFGREANFNGSDLIFTNGFESGNTSAWSATTN